MRDYQTEANKAVVDALNSGMARPLVCLPTGSGKTPTINALVYRFRQRMPNRCFIICTHTQELIEQSAIDYENMTGETPGIYSASLKKKQVYPVTFAQIQSAARSPFVFQSSGIPTVVIIDECDRVPVEGEGQYRSFIDTLSKINPDLKVVGFTATPYRMSTGLIYGQGQPFDDLVYDAGVRTLIDRGYLCRLVGKDIARPDITSVKIRNGDFVESDLEQLMAKSDVVNKAVDEIILYGLTRQSWLVFVAGTKHAEMVRATLSDRGIDCAVILGETKKDDRKEKIAAFRAGNLRCLISINVLSVGFNVPHVDMIVTMRPTLSPGLYYQQLGRGLRIANGKQDCLVLDFAGNIARHGAIDTLNDRIEDKKKDKKKGEAPVKSCPECKTFHHAAVRKCDQCGYEFPPPEVVKHSHEADVNGPLAELRMTPVNQIRFYEHTSKDSAKPNTLLVVYQLNNKQIAREWLSVSQLSPMIFRRRSVNTILELVRPDCLNRFAVSSDCKLTYTFQGVVVLIETPNQLIHLYPCFRAPNLILIRPPDRGSKYPTIAARKYDTCPSSS